MTSVSPAAVEEFGAELAGLGWVTDLLVAGSPATGDHVPGVSDLDLVALARGPVDAARRAALAGVHRRLDMLSKTRAVEQAAAHRGWSISCAPGVGARTSGRPGCGPP